MPLICLTEAEWALRSRALRYRYRTCHACGYGVEDHTHDHRCLFSPTRVTLYLTDEDFYDDLLDGLLVTYAPSGTPPERPYTRSYITLYHGTEYCHYSAWHYHALYRAYQLVDAYREAIVYQARHTLMERSTIG